MQDCAHAVPAPASQNSIITKKQDFRSFISSSCGMVTRRRLKSRRNPQPLLRHSYVGRSKKRSKGCVLHYARPVKLTDEGGGLVQVGVEHPVVAHEIYFFPERGKHRFERR